MFLILYLLLCGIAGVIGSTRVVGFWGFFLLSLILTPVATLAVLAVTSRKTEHA
jgi:hypothetical protein